MKKLLKKEYLLIVFIFIAIFSTILINPLGNLDEIWNYNVAKNIADGKIPYKEISTITTPLLPFLNSIFLKLITNELIIMRILAGILGTAILYMIFKIVKLLTKEINISMIITIGIGLLFREIYCIDYNYMVLFFSLSILYIELKKETEKTKNKSFWIGILAGLAICTKQSIGAIIAIAVVVAPFIEKCNLKEFGKRILGISIPCILLLAYLLITNSVKDFMNYAVQGISTFNNYIPYKKLFDNESIEVVILAKIIPITVSITILTSIITKIISIKKPEMPIEVEEKFKNIQKLTLYSLPMLVVIYPISDKIHFLIGVTIAIITITYCIFILAQIWYRKISCKQKKFHYKTITLIIWITMVAIIGIKCVENLQYYINNYTNGKINKTITHYRNIEISENLKTRIIEIDKYIQQKEEQGIKVYILDAESAVYTIPLDKYTKDYDMFLKGNIGKDGEEGQIEKINNEADENTIYLIKKEDYILNWQTPLKVINYVKENFKNIGEIEIYDAYMQ